MLFLGQMARAGTPAPSGGGSNEGKCFPRLDGTGTQGIMIRNVILILVLSGCLQSETTIKPTGAVPPPPQFISRSVWNNMREGSDVWLDLPDDDTTPSDTPIISQVP